MKRWKTLLFIMWVLQTITRHEKIHWSLYYLRMGMGRKCIILIDVLIILVVEICCFWAPLLSPKEDVLCNIGAWISAIQSQSCLLSVPLRCDSGNRRPWSSCSTWKDCQRSCFHWVLVITNNLPLTVCSWLSINGAILYLWGSMDIRIWIEYRSSQDQIHSYFKHLM